MRMFTVSCVFWTTFLLTLPVLPANGLLIAFSAILMGVAYQWPVCRSLCAGYIVACVFLAWTLIELESAQLRSDEISSDIRLKVRVTSVPQQADWGHRFNAQVLSCESCSTDFGPTSLQLSWYRSSQTVRAGEHWEFTVRLKPFRGYRNDGSFDKTQWAAYKRLDARGYVRKKPAPLKLETSEVLSVADMRSQLSERLLALPAADTGAGLVQALVLGVKHNIEQQTWSLLRDTGTSHLVAISGLHISLLAAWTYYFASKFLPQLLLFITRVTPRFRTVDSRSGALIVSVLCAGAYALLAGFELPVQRALAMLMVWAIAMARLRHLAPAWGLALAMLVVLGNNILSVLSPGLWLSFGTVAILFYLHRGRIHSPVTHEAVAGSWTSLRIAGVKTLAMGRTHVFLGLALLPITAWFFQAGSVVAPLANLFAVPWVGFVVVPLSFLSVLLSAWWSSAADLALMVAQWSINALLYYLQSLADLNHASVPLTVPSVTALVLSLVGVLALFSPKGLGFKRYALILLLPLLLFNAKPPRVTGFNVHVLDVGQGLATLVFTESHTLLFDTGGKISSSLSMVEAVVMPYLHAQGRREIDYLVVSHADEDHAFGVADIVRRFPNVTILGGGDVQTEVEFASTPCEAGDVWNLDNVQFSVLHPAIGDAGGDNDRSCVILVHFGTSRALLTGDIERRGETQLAKRLGELGNGAKGVLPVDLIVAPHHGSRTSSSAELLAQVPAKHVVFTAGYQNRYGFPHVEVQLRYKLMGAKQYTTGTHGAVAFSFGRTGLLEPPVTWWQTSRRFWHGFVNPACSGQFAEHAIVIQQLLLAQKGQSLCGK